MAELDRGYYEAKAIALRLLLAQLGRDSDAIERVHGEIQPELLERPERMSHVLAALVGIAAAEINVRHCEDSAAAARSIEAALADALDAAAAAGD